MVEHRPTYRNKVKTLPKVIARIFHDLKRYGDISTEIFNVNAVGGGSVSDPADPTDTCSCCARSLTVSKDGLGDFATIQEAIDFAVTQTPAVDEPWVIFICPGEYAETLVGADYVTLVGNGRADSVIVSGATGPLLTLPDDGGHVAHIKFELAPTTTDQIIIDVPGTHNGPTELWDLIFDIASATNDIVGQFVNLQRGELFLRNIYMAYDMDGTHANAKTHHLIDISGASTYHLYNCVADLDIADVNDTFIFVKEDSTSAVQGYISNNEIKAYISNGAYTGIAGLFVLHGAGTNKFLISNNLRLENKGGAGDTGYIIYMDTTAGGGIISSLANHARCEGFASSYSVNVAAGDTVNSHFDKVYADDGWTGAGTFNFAGSYNDGNFSVSNNVNIANECRWLEGVNHVGFTAPALAGDQIWELMDADGGAGDLIQTDGAGALSFVESTSSITGEPTGFPNRTDSAISFVNGTRTFTIAATAGTFDYYIAGLKYTIASDNVIINNNDGVHVIYFDGAALTALHSPTHDQWHTIILDMAIVALVYWNVALVEGQLFEERHGVVMDGMTHLYLHETVGMAWDSGLALGDILADQDGSANAHAQFSNTEGDAFDEDLEMEIDAVGKLVGLQIWYIDANVWQWDTNAGYSVIDDGIGARLAYNDNVTPLVEVGNNKFVLCHVFATTLDSDEMIAIVGQAEYANKPAAQAGAETEILTLLLGDLPTPEMLPIATVIFQTSNAYGNAVKARIISTAEGDDYIDWRRHKIGSTGGVSAYPTLDDVYNNSGVTPTIIVDVAPITLDVADLMAWQIDSDITLTGDLAAATKVAWDTVIVSDDPGVGNTRTVSETIWDVDHQTSFLPIVAALAKGDDTYTFLDFDYILAASQGGVADAASFNLFDVDLTFNLGGLGTSPTVTGYYINFKKATNPMFTVDVVGVVSVAETIEHIGDTDTRILFTTDQITFDAGNINLLELIEAAQDEVVFNQDGLDVDHRIESLNLTHMLFIEGSVDTVGIDEAAPDTNVILHLGGASGQGKGFRNDHPPRCLLYLNSAQNNLVAGAWTQVVLDGESYDSDAIGDPAVNYRITPDVEGYYNVSGTVSWSGGFAVGDRLSGRIQFNGATTVSISHAHSSVVEALSNPLPVKAIYFNGSTDYVELEARPGTAGNTADLVANEAGTWLAVHRVS